MNPFEEIALELLAQASVQFTQAGIQALMALIAKELAKQNSTAVPK